eukprot:CAMPEP_0172185354 /NCGR_PEP_ID=MMETSP1050-20130122/20119_1 /TAXON_ID=233186 /ORGANISM="Cryptomonas curvata, Strain CCAP979/52" /LENGTH=98 /DNA_ID=CAMNT_0012859323 /DNA_START=168 /DNA_END=465 /DNA_ORIENTATION=+
MSQHNTPQLRGRSGLAGAAAAPEGCVPAAMAAQRFRAAQKRCGGAEAGRSVDGVAVVALGAALDRVYGVVDLALAVAPHPAGVAQTHRRRFVAFLGVV